MSWNSVELLPCRASAIDHFPSWFVMSFLSSWKWPSSYLETSSYGYFFLIMFLSGVSIHHMNASCNCTFNSCSSSPAWTHPNIYSRNHNIKSNRTFRDGCSSWHLLVGINILHTCWHISQRYWLSRVFIFSEFHQSLHIFSGRFPSQVFLVLWMLIAFIMVAYLTIPCFLTHSIPRSFQPEFLNCSQSPHTSYEDI